jgi:hypothetical protein
MSRLLVSPAAPPATTTTTRISMRFTADGPPAARLVNVLAAQTCGGPQLAYRGRHDLRRVVVVPRRLSQLNGTVLPLAVSPGRRCSGAAGPARCPVPVRASRGRGTASARSTSPPRRRGNGQARPVWSPPGCASRRPSPVCSSEIARVTVEFRGAAPISPLVGFLTGADPTSSVTVRSRKAHKV